MKQSLQLKLGQSLTLTPQLQQAIKLLQLSTLDLQQAIEETLESNPLLEREEEAALEQAADDDGNAPGENAVDFSEPESNTAPDSSDDLPVDTRWEDLIPSSAPTSSGPSGDDYNFDDRDSNPDSLQTQLQWQLNLTRFSDTDHAIALALIDSVDSDGRLTQTPDEIRIALDDPDIELDEVVAVLHRLQHFEPTGVFAQDLRECLLIQLRQMPLDTPYRETAGALVSRYLDQLASGSDIRSLARRLRCDEDTVSGAVALIRSLDPTPGASLNSEDTEYIVPDVFVRKVNGHWRVELNPDIAPKLCINNQYTKLMEKGHSDGDRSFVKDNLQEARWFMKSLQSRNETLLKVGSKIVEHQRQFLEVGEEAMRPLVLSEIASQIGMHESTVSRATTRKYMHTPRGVFELKYFFSSHVANVGGGETSSTAIKALIRKLVQGEDQRKPLSDSKLCTLLEQQGVTVARRTVAKYREQLNIAPSNERKRLI
ncbi:RNA polymerase sigma-54 factor [Luminiphilus syltensis NOR5-1B]|uniref:RNA polymerase sigma-54 factor n=1 Tax=Luminiphilus syltensis NOR5-1B TaxID=565045 RepID=B8KR86_9GAMM|nr:RNA polymerase factor sigma-54 [Luminiphilus syltensis]EED36385.1 RNA polymerase sigma-54 factor [Luminiphilus syltensis NOR5-1B]